MSSLAYRTRPKATQIAVWHTTRPGAATRLPNVANDSGLRLPDGAGFISFVIGGYPVRWRRARLVFTSLISSLSPCTSFSNSTPMSSSRSTGLERMAPSSSIGYATTPSTY